MRRLILAATAAALGSAVFNAGALGSFSHLTHEVVTGTLSGGRPVRAVRVHAVFTSPTDQLVMVVNSDLSTVEWLYQHPLGGATEPDASLVSTDPDLAFDTFVTVGQLMHARGDVASAVTPGTGFLVDGFAGDRFSAHPTAGVAGADLRVLIGQFSFDDPGPGFYTCVGGEVSIGWKSRGGPTMFTPPMSLPSAPLSGCPWPWLGDQDQDLDVDGLDLAILLGAWGPCAAPCLADLNGDGTVNGIDLAILLGNWG